jgi:hypothetical protein
MQKIRIDLVGGGNGAFIGAYHPMEATLDGKKEHLTISRLRATTVVKYQIFGHIKIRQKSDRVFYQIFNLRVLSSLLETRQQTTVEILYNYAYQ